MGTWVGGTVQTTVLLIIVFLFNLRGHGSSHYYVLFFGPLMMLNGHGTYNESKMGPSTRLELLPHLYLPPTSRHTCSSEGLRIGLGSEWDLGVFWLFDSARASHATSEESLTHGGKEKERERRTD